MYNKSALKQLREIAVNKEIHVAYGKVPGENKSIYIENRFNSKLRSILIDNSIKETIDEIEELAYCIGLVAAREDLKLGTFNSYKEDDPNIKLAYKLAAIHQEEILKGVLTND